ncbi:hypothetical protein ACSBR2_005924 [Camellia fascicularis]
MESKKLVYRNKKMKGNRYWKRRKKYMRLSKLLLLPTRSSGFFPGFSPLPKKWPIWRGPYGSEWPIVEKVKHREMVAPGAQEEIPVLYVYESQLGPHVQRKGLGKFLMQLIELIAHKNQMGAVVLTVQKENLLAMNFYMSKLRYTISTISPSRADPLMGLEKSYEILCKAFDHEAKAILEAFLGWLNTSFPSNSGAGLRRKNALLVIAHPDDESMFFTPTINYLTSRGHNLHIMCSSTGSTPTSEDPGPSRFAGWFWQSMEL